MVSGLTAAGFVENCSGAPSPDTDSEGLWGTKAAPGISDVCERADAGGRAESEVADVGAGRNSPTAAATPRARARQAKLAAAKAKEAFPCLLIPRRHAPTLRRFFAPVFRFEVVGLFLVLDVTLT